jgi:PBP1b-binding outer membrane lipoprotein LpoB
MKKIILSIAVAAILIGGCARGRIETQKRVSSDSTKTDTSKVK